MSMWEVKILFDADKYKIGRKEIKMNRKLNKNQRKISQALVLETSDGNRLAFSNDGTRFGHVIPCGTNGAELRHDPAIPEASQVHVRVVGFGVANGASWTRTGPHRFFAKATLEVRAIAVDELRGFTTLVGAAFARFDRDRSGHGRTRAVTCNGRSGCSCDSAAGAVSLNGSRVGSRSGGGTAFVSPNRDRSAVQHHIDLLAWNAHLLTIVELEAVGGRFRDVLPDNVGSVRQRNWDVDRVEGSRGGGLGVGSGGHGGDSGS